MTRITRPRDDRDSDDLKAWELPATDSNAPASCPLLDTIKLLPLRYGRVETLPQGSEADLPYEMQSRPLGYRLPRNGYIYVLDENAQALHEYVHLNGELSGYNSGKLEYPSTHTLYVCFSDVALTDKKKAQVLSSEEERAFFMQKIDLSSASPVSGGKHLLTPEQATLQVAEFAENYQPEPPEDGHPQEREPYHWENQPYYHKTRFGKLIRQQDVEDPCDCLCLVLRDDVGVMLDLAQHQDDVVGWIESWTEEGDSERDYFLGTLIESMTLLDQQGLDSLMANSDHPAIVAMQQDMQAMPESERSKTQTALLVALRQMEDEKRPGPNDAALPADVKAEVEKIRSTANRTNAYSILPKMHRAVDQWYVRQAMESAQPEFVDGHIDGIVALEKDHRRQLKNILEGQGFGRRGVNDLIDREAMDEFMAGQRVKLARWQSLLTDITADRIQLLTSNHYHQAAWYFDPEDEAQIEAALDLEYACRKDICRSDEASESVLTWLKQNPQYSRPLFQTLPKHNQSEEGELAKIYLAVGSAGYAVMTEALSWAQKIRAAESGKLPNFSNYSQLIQQKADAVGDTITPAIAMAKGNAIGKLYQAIESQALPDLDDLFRDLPYFFKRRMLDAIDQGKVEFRIASEHELATFRDNLRKMLQLDQRLKQLQQDHKVAKSTHGHRSETAQTLVAEFKATREEHRNIGKRVAAALSPVEETETGLKLEPAVTGRAALTLVLPALDQQELGRLMGHFRQGLGSAPRVNLMGDGLGFLVFGVQLANLWRVSSEVDSSSAHSTDKQRLYEAVWGTAAAGFLAAQGLMDTAYSARAQALAGVWQRSTVAGVHVRMGRLHVWLGGPAYLFGAISAGMGAYQHRENWLKAVQSGNTEAQAGAMLGMIGSGGLAVTNAYGFGRTLSMGLAVGRASKGAARAQAWATAGRTLSGLFARLNVAGLVFTVFELGGTWLYNRHNLGERDKWLQTTPWSREPAQIHNGPLEAYGKAFARIGSSVTLDEVPGDDGEIPRLQLNCHSIPANRLIEPLEGKAPYRVSLSAWRIQPRQRKLFSLAPETWVPCTGAILADLEQSDSAEHLQLAFSPPEHRKTEQGLRTRDLGLMVRLETLQADGNYTGAVYMLKVTPDSQFPLIPIQEPPESKVIWWPLHQPFSMTDSV